MRCWRPSRRCACDELFERVRERMRSFNGVKTAAQPAGFVGQLRDYQCEGLGWMEFLREFGFGGCLADDMGVGKTAQVLAVAGDRARTEGHGPSLVVAPKSLMFNWRAEALRFTPQLRVLEHTGLARDTALIGQHDLVLTTYGTLLRDAAQLAEMEFDYVVLDEAQAVKNSSTASAKAVRLLRGAHRLALSGTPVENHLGELWSLFEFLNPGMLGEAKVLNMAGGWRAIPARMRAAFSPKPCVRSSCAAPNSRWRANCRRRPNRPSTANSKARRRSSTTNCANTTARRCWRACNRRASANRRCTCWKRCCACARRPAIPDCST